MRRLGWTELASLYLAIQSGDSIGYEILLIREDKAELVVRQLLVVALIIRFVHRRA